MAGGMQIVMTGERLLVNCKDKGNTPRRIRLFKDVGSVGHGAASAGRRRNCAIRHQTSYETFL